MFRPFAALECVKCSSIQFQFANHSFVPSDLLPVFQDGTETREVADVAENTYVLFDNPHRHLRQPIARYLAEFVAAPVTLRWEKGAYEAVEDTAITGKR